jgi:hypothetical protein
MPGTFIFRSILSRMGGVCQYASSHYMTLKFCYHMVLSYGTIWYSLPDENSRSFVVVNGRIIYHGSGRLYR